MFKVYTAVMTYDIGTHISFTVNKQPPYVHLTVKSGISHEYAVGSRVILNELINQVSEVINITVNRSPLNVVL